MKIFKISHSSYGYEKYLGHVIVANSVQEVRQLAKDCAADEGEDVWNDAEVTECGNYTAQTNSFILLSDFRAG